MREELEHVFDAGLGVAVEAAAEVWDVFFGERWADDLRAVGVVVGDVDACASINQHYSIASCRGSSHTSRSHHREMDVSISTLRRQHQGAHDVRLHCLHLVVFAPVDVGSACFASAVDDMGGFDLVEDFAHAGLVLHADCRCVDILVLLV